MLIGKVEQQMRPASIRFEATSTVLSELVGRCASNAGCSTGAVCDMTSTVVSSTCSNGVDSSIPLGTCKAMCDLDSTKQELARLNSLV